MAGAVQHPGEAVVTDELVQLGQLRVGAMTSAPSPGEEKLFMCGDG